VLFVVFASSMVMLMAIGTLGVVCEASIVEAFIRSFVPFEAK